MSPPLSPPRRGTGADERSLPSWERRWSYFDWARGIFSFWPAFSRLRLTPGLASAMSLALMPKSLAIFAAESPFDSVITSGGGGCGAELANGVSGLDWIAAAGFPSIAGATFNGLGSVAFVTA